MTLEYESPWIEIISAICLFSSVIVMICVSCHLLFNQPTPSRNWTKVGHLSSKQHRL